MISGLKFDVAEEGLAGIWYEIAKPGFGLPLHAHATRDEYHAVYCSQGPLVVFGSDWFKVLRSGERFTDFDNGQLHGITAEGPAKWFNGWLSGQEPEAIAAMRPDERHTDLNSRIDLPNWILVKLNEPGLDLTQKIRA